MDTQLLSQLNNDLLQQALGLWAQIQQAQADATRLRDRIANAVATLQAIQSATATISQPARTDLATIVSIGDRLLGVSTEVRSFLNIDTASLSSRVQAVKNGLQNVQTLQAQAISALTTVMQFYDRLQQLQSPGNELAVAKAAFSDYVTKWLNKDFTFTVANEPLVVHFTTTLGATRPFSGTAQLAAKIVYSAFTADVNGVSLTVDAGGGVIPNFSAATISPNFNPSQFASAIAGQIAAELPAGITVSNPHLDTTSSVPTILIDAKMAGLPVFDTLSFDATIRVFRNRVAIENASGGLDALLVPVPPGTTAIKGFTFGFQKTPIPNVIDSPALKVGTSIVPTADGGTGATIALDLRDSAGQIGGIFFPLNNLGKAFSFQGNLTLLKTFTCGTINGSFKAVPPEFSLHLDLPGQSKSPFGGANIFKLKADAHVDQTGLTFTGNAEYFTVIKGDVSGNISFSGDGHITANVGANAFGASATFSSEWEPGFKTLTVVSSVSMDLNIKGFARFTASIDVQAAIENEHGVATANAVILGQPIVNKKFDTDDNLQEILENFLADNLIATAIFNRVFELGKKFLESIDPNKVNQFLRRTFASLDPFKAIEGAVPGAKQIFDDAETAINNAKKAAEDAAKDPVGTVTGVAKKWKRKVFGLSLVDGGSGLGLVDLPTLDPTEISGTFLSSLDTLFDNLQRIQIAKSLADKLSAIDPIDVPLKPQLKARPDEQVSSRITAKFDQIVVGANDINAANDSSKSTFVGFFVTGGTSTRRNGQFASVGLKEWGHVKFEEIGGVNRATITVNVDNKPIEDASLLRVAYTIFQKLKDLVLAISPGIQIVNGNGIDGNLLVAPPALNPFFDQPPFKKLPVVGRLGIERVAAGPSGIRIIKLTLNGAADKAGLKVDDVIASINGQPINSTKQMALQLKSSPQPALAMSVISGGVTSPKTVVLDAPPL